MAISIKSEEAARLARQISAETGESTTDAVVSLRERRDRITRSSKPGIAERLDRLSARVARLSVDDPRTPDEIIGYDVPEEP